MNPKRLLILLPLFTLILTTLSPAQFNNPFGQQADSGPHVRARMVADTMAIEAGMPFRLGVRFTMDPEWHTYWVNGGDVGYATSIDWDLPEGFKVGPLQWPVPERIEQMDLISYAHSDEVLLYAEVTPPAELPAGMQTVSLKANAAWLACKEACIPGEQDVALDLPVGQGKPSPDAKDFDRTEKLVPTRLLNEPFDELILTVEPASLPPVLTRTIDVDFTLYAGTDWTIDASDTTVNGLYPRVGPSWNGTHPRLISQGERTLVYQWTLEPLESKGNVDELAAVVSVMLKNAASGENQRLVGTYRFTTEGTLTDAKSTTATKTTGTVNSGESLSTGPSESATGAESTIVSDELRGLSFIDELAQTHSLAWYLLLALLGGMILNVMPCVLPVISLKVLSFVKQAGESRGRVLQMGVAFTLGVLVSFLLLAAMVVGLKMAGAQVGWGFQFQEPRFVIAMAAIVLVFGLSLFGVFEINLPGRAASKMESAAAQGGLAGAFFNGVLATALATPCTAPLLGPALGFAFNQSPVMIVLFFLTIGLGLALPYLLLSMNPSWLRFLPKPGAWMGHFKQLMGFLLLATLVWLLWVLGAQIGNDGVARTMAFLVALALACWLIGLGWDYGSTRLRRWTYTLFALVAAGGGLAFPASYLANHSALASSAAVSHFNTDSGDGIDWQPFSVELVENLVDNDRMVFLDFTADWCLTCQANDRTVLTTDRVRQAFEKYDVVAVKADWTRRDRTIGDVLRQFGRSGVPLYVILPSGHASKPVVLDTVLTPGHIEESLAKAAALNP